MRRIKFSIILLLLLAVCLAGAGFAQLAYPVQYWIVGQVENADDGTSANGLTVVVHPAGDPNNALASAVVKNNGYAINFLWMQYSPTGTYQVSIVRSSQDAYGAGPVSLFVSGYGFEVVPTMKISQGGEEEAAEGAVILSIEKMSEVPGSAIKVSWRINTQDYPQLTGNEVVDIYYIVGDEGSGAYEVMDYDSMIIESDDLASRIPPGVSLVQGEKAFLWNNQVADGEPEIYFKGTLHGMKNDTAMGLPSAVAVGKLNVRLQGEANNPGKNLISLPFLANDVSVAGVFGQGSGTEWQEGDLVQYKFAASPAYESAVYSNGAWRDAANPADPPAFDVDYRFGNWIITSGTRRLTFVGKVLNIDVTVPIFGGSGLSTGGKTLLGMVYPMQFGLAQTSLIADGALEGDLVQYKVSPLNQVYVSAVVIGGQWKNAANPAEPLDPNIAILKTPYSYIYVRYGNAGFDWNRSKPTVIY